MDSHEERIRSATTRAIDLLLNNGYVADCHSREAAEQWAREGQNQNKLMLRPSLSYPGDIAITISRIDAKNGLSVFHYRLSECISTIMNDSNFMEFYHLESLLKIVRSTYKALQIYAPEAPVTTLAARPSPGAASA